jgi:hypothetical protein
MIHGCAAVPGSNIKFLTPTHPAEAAPRQAKLAAAKPIVVGSGENTVVGAGGLEPGTCAPTWSPLPTQPA